MSARLYIDCVITGTDFVCDRQKITSGNEQSLFLRTSFSEDWAGLTKYINFRIRRYGGNEVNQKMLDGETSIGEYLDGASFFEYGFIGKDSDGVIMRSTNLCTILIEDGAYIINPGAKADDLTLVGRVNAAEQKADAASVKADAAVLSANSANEKAEEANAKADTAVLSANSANEKAEEANAKADAAVLSANSANEKAESAVGIANEAKAVSKSADTTAKEALKGLGSHADSVNPHGITPSLIGAAPIGHSHASADYSELPVDISGIVSFDLPESCFTVTSSSVAYNSDLGEEASVYINFSGTAVLKLASSTYGRITINGESYVFSPGIPVSFEGVINDPFTVTFTSGTVVFEKFSKIVQSDGFMTAAHAKRLFALPDIENAVKELKDDAAKALKGTEAAGKNLFNKDTVSVVGEWIGTKGQFESNEYTTKYFHSDYIPVEGGESYTYSGGGAYGTRMYSYVWYDSNKALVSRVGDTYYNSEPLTIVSPDNACYIAINFYDGISTVENVQFEKGTEATEYEAFGGSGGFYCDNLIIKPSQIEGYIPEEETEESAVKLIHLPEKYELVVGDTFELFYKGIMLCKNPYNYNIFVSCNIGKAWERKFEVTPTTAGTYPLTITVSDDEGNVIDTASTNLIVEAKMTSPASITNVLCIGDSLTTGGEWVDEVYRRLTKTSDTTSKGHAAPTGEGLTNINFIGKKTTVNGAGYEGFGGWRFEDYLSTSTTTTNYWLTCTHTKTDNDQEAIYEDENGVQWQLETIETSKLKFKKFSGSGTMPKTGTLTHVSGGVDTSDIVFTKVTLEDGNPFVYNGAIDFASYCNDIGATGIDVCYILLGWNNVSTEKETYKSQVKSFIDLLLSYNQSMKIVLMGLQIPSLDGCANNYGAKGNFASWRRVQEYVFALDGLYGEVASEYPNNVTAINISGQFDTENNMLTTSMDVNARNTAKVVVQSNGLHPAVFGYYQIADAVYRKFNNDNN